jgi:hypothetical protein
MKGYTMRRRLSLLDEKTGELINMPVYLNSPHKHPTIYGDRWFQMSQDPLLALSKDRELWGLPQAVLLYLCGRLDFDNYVHVPQQEIADHLIASRPKVTKAVSLLVKKGILIKGPTIGRSGSYRLNPAYGWKGDNKKAKEYQLELIKGGRE